MTIDELMKKKYQSSGLSDDHAKKMKLKALRGPAVKALASNFVDVGAMQFPYFDLEGKQTKFYRIRYLEEMPGFAGQQAKPQRYSQPADTINEIYLPPLLDVAWSKVADDGKAELIITEGELKAAAGCAIGIPTIGLGGVSMWSARKRMMPMLPGLEKFEWKDRVVYIIFDSDASEKEQVIAAQRALGKELLERGARPSFVPLPPAKDGSKQGLDDFLVANGGGEALLPKLADAPMYPEADALWSLNQDLVYVRKPGFVVERRTNYFMNTKAFINEVYANKHFVDLSKDKPGKKPLAPAWVKWEGRFEMDSIGYFPGKPKVVDRKWNSWNGWGCEPKPGNVEPWIWLMKYIFSYEPAAMKWFEQWCAYPLQYPGTKLYSAVMLWSVATGTGKTMVAYTLKRIYGENFAEVKSGTIKKDFNAWAKNRQFVYGDEISGGQARLDSDKLKGMITQEHVTINEKYLPEYAIEDCMNWIFSSNHADALFLDAKDRRYMVHEIRGEAAPREKYEWYDKWLKGDGPSHLFHYLLNLDLTGFNPREHAPMTESKRAMVVSSMSDLGEFVERLRTDPISALLPLGKKAAIGCDLYTTTLLSRIVDPDGSKRYTPALIGRVLQGAGIRAIHKGDQIRTATGIKRLYAVRNPNKWLGATPKKCAAHYDQFFALGGGKEAY